MTKDAAWLLIAFPICIAVFGVIEYYAIRHPDRQNTLSRFIYNTGSRTIAPIASGWWRR